jgi:hypothetical protein
MFYRVNQRLLRSWFNFSVRRLPVTPPLVCDAASEVVLVSQLCHRDVFMYLVAVKSFARYIKPLEVVVLDDGSVTAGDTQLLSRHVRNVRIVKTSELKGRGCPVGGCWERLLFVADAVEHNYVIQIDADTITLGDPEEVRQCITERTSFTLGTKLGRHIASMGVACMAAKQYGLDCPDDVHVQTVAEMGFDRLPDLAELKYVRGNAGFAGYARGSFQRELLEEFSCNMGRIVGEQKWAEWGSEQVASNVVVANSPRACVLPFSKYSYYYPELPVDQCTFIHFIGDHRFKNGTYRALSRAVIRELC